MANFAERLVKHFCGGNRKSSDSCCFGLTNEGLFEILATVHARISFAQLHSNILNTIVYSDPVPLTCIQRQFVPR